LKKNVNFSFILKKFESIVTWNIIINIIINLDTHILDVPKWIFSVNLDMLIFKEYHFLFSYAYEVRKNKYFLYYLFFLISHIKIFYDWNIYSNISVWSYLQTNLKYFDCKFHIKEKNSEINCSFFYSNKAVMRTPKTTVLNALFAWARYVTH